MNTVIKELPQKGKAPSVRDHARFSGQESFSHVRVDDYGLAFQDVRIGALQSNGGANHLEHDGMLHGTSPTDDARMADFLSGKRLYGNDFGPEDLDRWYAEEAEGYADLGAKERDSYHYEYHALNWQHAYRHLPDRGAWRILGLGSAYGEELRPMLDQAQSITILDPSSAFEHERLGDVPLQYVKPQVSGIIPIADDSFDLATSFGVLHHIANVGFVLSEIFRTLASGGYFVLREPIVSMGDWRLPRPGLTRNERGIPLDILRQLTRDAGFKMVRETLCDFPLTRPILGKFRGDVFNDKTATIFDAAISQLFAWNIRYHATSNWQKLRPASCAMVLKKS